MTMLVFAWCQMAHRFTFGDESDDRGHPGRLTRRDDARLVSKLDGRRRGGLATCRDDRHARLESGGLRLRRGGWAARTKREETSTMLVPWDYII